MRSSIKFDRVKINEFTSPLVYIFIKDNIIIYVGRSKNGISKPFAPIYTSKEIEKPKDKQLKEARELADEVRFCICDSEEESINLEIDLLKKYKPSLNPVFNEGHRNLSGYQTQQQEFEKKKDKDNADKLLKDFGIIN